MFCIQYPWHLHIGLEKILAWTLKKPWPVCVNKMEFDKQAAWLSIKQLSITCIQNMLQDLWMVPASWVSGDPMAKSCTGSSMLAPVQRLLTQLVGPCDVYVPSVPYFWSNSWTHSLYSPWTQLLLLAQSVWPHANYGARSSFLLPLSELKFCTGSTASP